MLASLRRKLQACALADAIIEPDWEYRYFSYNAHWADQEAMASLRDGSGGEWFLWLAQSPAGVALAGYKCWSPADGAMADLPAIKDRLPEAYQAFVTEPAFSMDTATSLWYLHAGHWLKHGLKVEHLIDLEQVMAWTARDYHAWAEEYYERELPLIDLERLFNHDVDLKLAKRLNPAMDGPALREDLQEIGLAVAG